jgi:hypothetical protein
VLPEEEQHPHNTTLKAEHNRRHGQTREGRNQMTFERWEDEQNENQRLWQDWDERHMPAISNISMTFAVMAVNPHIDASMDTLEIAMETLLEEMSWNCPSDTLDPHSTYHQALERSKDLFLYHIRELKKRGVDAPDTGWWGKELR